MDIENLSLPGYKDLEPEENGDQIRGEIFNWIVDEVIQPSKGQRAVDLGAGHCDILQTSA